ncbi:MAG: helix-turn-helix transcriptional regulator [Ruminococcaceae bacterium]|nr:helix-turn-helix transcriptional regulator [Oscillospiraceae bacterium]
MEGMKITNQEIGFRIRQQRELLGYTREQLAEKINVSTKFCADIEIGAKGMSVETLCKISKELMLTTDYILFGKTYSDIDEEFLSLISRCGDEKRIHLKNIVRNFIQACSP